MLETITANALPHRFDKPKGIIVHCSGADDKHTDEQHDEAVRRYYHQNDDKVCPHFFINYLGQTFKIADPASQEAWHCAMSKAEASLYAQGLATWQSYRVKDHKQGPVKIDNGVELYKHWRDTWWVRGMPSPLGLGFGDCPNYHSVGVELQSLREPTSVVFNGAQYEALAVLLNTLTVQFKLPVNRMTIMGHSDANPMSRPPSAYYDPGTKFDWDGVFKTVLTMGPKR